MHPIYGLENRGEVMSQAASHAIGQAAPNLVLPGSDSARKYGGCGQTRFGAPDASEGAVA
jgi:hypothetical protein